MVRERARRSNIYWIICRLVFYITKKLAGEVKFP